MNRQAAEDAGATRWITDLEDKRLRTIVGDAISGG
jgi:hypothetical protein